MPSIPRARTLFVVLSLVLATPAFGAAENQEPQTLEASFVDGADRSSWYWSLQPSVLGGPLPDPQDQRTLPVSVLAGEPDRSAALRFDIAERGVPHFSVALSATLRIEEGTRAGEQPAVDPERAKLEACPATGAWTSGAAEPAEQAPQVDAAACVRGQREGGTWMFDLGEAAGPWADDPGANHGVVVRASEMGATSELWQVNLDRGTARLSLTYLPPPPTDGYPEAGDATGVSASSIRIGLHASISGGVPGSPSSMVEGARRYWEQGDAGGPVEIWGRGVEVRLRDDRANPTTARDVCRDLIEDEGVFLIAGLSGVDETEACAGIAASLGVPYVSLGTGEAGLRPLRNAFAVSATYDRQSAMLAQYVRETITTDAERVAVIVTDTPSLDGAVSAFGAGLPGAAVYRPSRASPGHAFADALCAGPAALVDAAYVLTSPAFFLELVSAATCQVRYVGVGMTLGLDALADVGCGRGPIDGARFLSPAPAFADAGTYDVAFLEAGANDDIEWLLWGLWRQLHPMLAAPGPDLDRRGFVDAAEGLSVSTGVYPDLTFSRSDHFGAHAAHVLRATCDGEGGRFVTERAFWAGP